MSSYVAYVTKPQKNMHLVSHVCPFDGKRAICVLLQTLLT